MSETNTDSSRHDPVDDIAASPAASDLDRVGATTDEDGEEDNQVGVFKLSVAA